MQQGPIPQPHQKLQQIHQLFSTLQQRYFSTMECNAELEKQLANAIERRDNEIKVRDARVQNVGRLMEELGGFVRLGRQETERVERLVDRSMDMCQKQIEKKVHLISPQFDFQYIINGPKYFPTLSQKLAEIQANFNKDKTRREDQIRTLKIRISLAQIQLKQLRNRSKKA